MMPHNPPLLPGARRGRGLPQGEGPARVPEHATRSCPERLVAADRGRAAALRRHLPPHRHEALPRRGRAHQAALQRGLGEQLGLRAADRRRDRPPRRPARSRSWCPSSWSSPSARASRSASPPRCPTSTWRCARTRSGRLFPGILKVLWAARRITRLRVLLLGVLPEWHGQGRRRPALPPHLGERAGARATTGPRRAGSSRTTTRWSTASRAWASTRTRPTASTRGRSDGGSPSWAVTGATGFVGSHLVEALAARGDASPRSCARPRGRGALPARGAGSSRATSRTSARWRGSWRAQDVVFHVAGLVAARDRGEFAAREPRRRGAVARRGAARPGWARFVLVSSLAATGPSRPGVPVDEACGPGPGDGSTAAASGPARRRCARPASPLTIVRPPAVYGPRDRAFLPLFQAARRGRRAAPRRRRGRSSRSVHARDLARALVAAATSARTLGRTYHAGNASRLTQRELGAGDRRGPSAGRCAACRCPAPLVRAVLGRRRRSRAARSDGPRSSTRTSATSCSRPAGPAPARRCAATRAGGRDPP